MRLFADDTVSLMHDSTFTNLVTDISGKFTQLHDWCISKKLTINNDKSKFVLFRTINKPVLSNFEQIDTRVMNIARVKTFQYLGIYFDETMKWNEHISFVCNLLVKYFGNFNHIVS